MRICKECGNEFVVLKFVNGLRYLCKNCKISVK